MSEANRPEPWLRGPLPGVHPTLMPAAHALLQAHEDVERVAASLSEEELWARPGGAASVGFHLRHVAGSIDRLLTYSRGEGLTEAQFQVLRGEGEPGGEDASALVREAQRAIEHAVEVIRAAPPESLQEPRGVGRAQLPTTVLGLLFHVAEHTQRHAGQIIATAKFARGNGNG